MNDQKKIGAFLAQARMRQGISREALAHSLHVDETEIAAWEAGEAYPALAQAPALARELSVSLDELFNARYHTVAEEYQVPEESFLPESSPPEEKPAAQAREESVPAPCPLPGNSRAPAVLPRWVKILLAVCLCIEGAAGCLLGFIGFAMLPFCVAAAAAAAAGATAAYFFGKYPLLRKRTAILLLLPCILLLFPCFLQLILRCFV